jgi:hypothetical protein
MVIAYAGYFALFLSLFCALLGGKLGCLKKEYRLWLLLVFFYALFMLLYGVLQGHEFRYISRDIWPFAYFACLLVATRKKAWKTIDRMILLHFIVAITVVLYVWLTYYGLDVTRRKILAVNISWTKPSLYYAWQLLLGWPYMLLAYSNSSLRRLIAVFGTGLYFLLALVFLKRLPIARLPLWILLIVVFPDNRIEIEEGAKGRIKPNACLVRLGLLALILLFLGGAVRMIRVAGEKHGVSYLMNLYNRYTSVGGSIVDTTLAYERFSRDPKLIFQQTESLEILVGQGLGSTVWRPRAYNTVVETAILTFFLKGGIIYVALWYFGLLGPVRYLLYRSQRRGFQLLVTSAVILSFASSFFDMNLETGYNMLWLGTCLASNWRNAQHS